jgi:hypothetical protein
LLAGASDAWAPPLPDERASKPRAAVAPNDTALLVVSDGSACKWLGSSSSERRMPSPRAGVVARLPCAVAACGRTPLASGMVLEEEQDAARRTAGAQSLAIGTGEELDGTRGEPGQDQLRAAGSVEVDISERWSAPAPAGGRRAGGCRACPVDQLEARASGHRAPLRPVHRHDVGACEVPVVGSSNTVAVAMRQMR